MPRTTTVENPGCPRLRALTFDALGLVKVIEARDGQNGGAAKMVERWGDPDSSKCVLAASILDRESDPLLGIARKCGSIEVISAINGDLRFQIPSFAAQATPEDDAITGLHLFRKHQSESSSRKQIESGLKPQRYSEKNVKLVSCELTDFLYMASVSDSLGITKIPRSCEFLTCTEKGHASIVSVEFGRSLAESIYDSSTQWNVCGSGNILCLKVDESENYALYGGKGVEVNVWDLQKPVKIWTAKSPPKNSLGIFTPTCFTSATFLSKDDHRKFVAGTDSHQVRLYDISAQRRPVMSIDFRETPIKAIAEDVDGQTIYIGNGSGDLASIDIRTGKLLGCFIGKCSGSIRSIVRHPELPVIASCGLDSYLRIWDIKSRQLLSAVFLKQHLNGVVFDSHFRTEEVAGSDPEPQSVEKIEVNHQEEMSAKWKKKSKELNGSKKMKSKKSSKRTKVEEI